MAELRLKSSRFRAEREADWTRLEQLLGRVEKRSAAALSDDELIAMPVLYRSALSSLSVARATSLDQNLIDYLEALAARAYFFVYGTRATIFERMGRFFARDLPAAAQSTWRESLLCLGLLLLGTITAYVLVQQDPSWFRAFVPGGLAEGRGPEASTEALRATLFQSKTDPSEGSWLFVFATYLFSHNSSVALMCFAVGFAFGLPTAILELQNGCMLGAFLAVFVNHGLGFEVGGWLAIHGITENMAIILAGGAGMRIGWALAFPGERTRLDSAGVEGRKAATLMIGVLAMLICAGALEGLGRQLVQSTGVRYAIGITAGLLWMLYLFIPRGRPMSAPDGASVHG